MRQIAITMAAAGFFGLAFVGWLSDVPIFVCGMRAIAGAAVLYLVISLAGTAAIRIIANAAAKTETNQVNAEKEKS